MTPKAAAMRASAEVSPAESPAISAESCNECPIARTDRTRAQSARRGFWDYSGRDRREIAARFWTKVKKSEACWLWTASVTGGNRVQHGQVTLPRVCGYQPHIYAHRLSWMLAYGPIPEGLQVCHHCDVPRCVRPDHLFLGTQDDNLKDAARKGRFHTPRTRTLTLADRLAIFHMPERRGVSFALALHYGVSTTCISLIRRGRFVGAPFQRAQAGAQGGDFFGQGQDNGGDAVI